MTVSIKIFGDYTCPFCFLSEKVLEEAVKGKDVEIQWMPFELRPFPFPTLKPEDDYMQSVWKSSVYPLAEKLDIPIVLPEISPQPHTFLAHEGYHFANERGKGNEYNQIVYQAYFQEENDIGDVNVLTRLAGQIGLNEVDFKESLLTRKYKEIQQKYLEEATRFQIQSVPTLIIEDKVFTGIRSKETLEKAIEEEAFKKSIMMDGQSCGIDGCC